MSILTVLAVIFMIAGLFFAMVGTVGVLRMPDIYGRLQASTCIATMSSICAGIAGILYAVSRGMGAGTVVRLLLFVVFILFSKPISNHALLKAAVRSSIKPANEPVIDDYAADFEAGTAEAAAAAEAFAMQSQAAAQAQAPAGPQAQAEPQDAAEPGKEVQE